MAHQRIIILRGTSQPPIPVPEDTVIEPFQQLKRWVKQGVFIKHLWRYRSAQLITPRLNCIQAPFLTMLVLRLFSQGSCELLDDHGNRQNITIGVLLHHFKRWLRDIIDKPRLLAQTRREIQTLKASVTKPPAVLNLARSPAYLRTELIFGLKSGGSIGHIAGVLNNLSAFTGPPLLLTTDEIPTVQPDIETHVILPGSASWNLIEMPNIAFNQTFFETAQRHLAGRQIGFVYQRYSMSNYAGLKLARAFNVPFVLEYNGSMIWMSQNWGQGLKYAALTEEIELLNLHGADVVVVVSQPMLNELVERGIDPAKILVNPNGVDPERYSPQVDGTTVRRRYDLEGKTVIGFIGTFGPWHGAEVLAEAFGRLVQQYPACREQVRLLLIGDGEKMPLVKDILARHNVEDAAVLTGLVPQAQGPAHLAACDILVSPHVPNPDGTPFFGSPTKLFEYMAMGKGIVASNLDQIGEVLTHNQTAWLVRPGDPDALVSGLMQLLDDASLCHRLGEAARGEVMAHYTWREHTRRIIAKLGERSR